MSEKKQEYRIFTDLTEIFSHNTRESLWLLIDNKVYDVTNFKHPGGKPILLSNAGQDATTQFEDIGHKDAEKHMKNLLIGEYRYQDDDGGQDKYPTQVAKPEHSLATRVGLGLLFVGLAFGLYKYIELNQ